MSNGQSLINLGDLSKTATVLIEKISDAIGGIFRPYQIRRVALAEAEAEKIKACTEIEINELRQRAIVRFVLEETKKQVNIESITSKSFGYLKKDARPEEIEDDWISNFFDKCRLITDEDMQTLWAKVLAGEANYPGTYSKRTVNFISSIDKSEAMLFTNLCSYGFDIGGTITLLVYDKENEIYTQNGINFESLNHLANIGLITFNSLTGFALEGIPEKTTVTYRGTSIQIKFKEKENNKLQIGHVLLSKIGEQLALVVGSRSVPGFVDYIINDCWSKEVDVVQRIT